MTRGMMELRAAKEVGREGEIVWYRWLGGVGGGIVWYIRSATTQQYEFFIALPSITKKTNMKFRYKNSFPRSWRPVVCPICALTEVLP